ncbi:MAG: DUF5996 family protein [Cellulosimicrobium cellulans]
MTQPAARPAPAPAPWPDLDVRRWEPTRRPLHLFTQVIGKVVLDLTPFVNHWWNVAFHVTSRGFVTPVMQVGDRALDVEIDLVAERVVFRTSDGSTETIALGPMSVADFYARTRACLDRLDVPVRVWSTPREIPDPVPFEQDTAVGEWDGDRTRTWLATVQRVVAVMERFRSGFYGKSSGPRFYWGAFDLGLTLFNGRPFHQPDDVEPIYRYAENAENLAVGYWPGDPTTHADQVYAYAYPQPPGVTDLDLAPGYWDPGLREAVLPCGVLRDAADPDAVLLAFFERSYRELATAAAWDLAAFTGPVPPG